MRNATSGATPMVLTPALRRYSWGDCTFLPGLLGLASSNEPCAEAWFGAYPQAPATVPMGGAPRRLDELFTERPDELLGAAAKTRFGGMPYLLKLLAVAKPLSIQVHPSLAEAQVGFAREEQAGIPRSAPERFYRDTNHKPELLVALTPFFALCGFRATDGVAAALAAAPELAALLPRPAEGFDTIRGIVEAYFALPDVVVDPALRSLVARLAARHAAEPFSEHDPRYWALRAHRCLSQGDAVDRGLLFVFLMDLVRLQPGEGLFIPAGVPHAYLEGAGLEVMASSDNVVRAGLTSKHVDAQALLGIVKFEASAPPRIRAVPTSVENEVIYPVPVPEFELRQVELREGSPVEFVAHGPETLLSLPEPDAPPLTLRWEGGQLELARGQACLVPHGLSYRVEAAGPGRLFRARLPGGEQTPSFRCRRPTELAFGTSGLRGLVTDITDLEAYVNARGFLDYLIASGDAVPGSTIALGGDLRPSTDSPRRSILRAVARAVRDCGLHAVYCGRLPTPALTYYGLRKGWPSIMVTGSHIPFDRNGIKFNKSTGEVLKPDEASITEAVARVRAIEYRRPPSASPFDDEGFFRPGEAPELPSSDAEAMALYRRRYLNVLSPKALSGLKVAVYQHSAVGRDLLVGILRDLGAEVCPVGRRESFVAIDTEAIDDAQLATVQQLADEARAQLGALDAVVSTDGDSDRPMVLGVEPDGRVHFFGGDVLGAVVATFLDADAVAVPVSSNDAIDRLFGPRGVSVVRTRIGSPWVIETMARMQGERRVGWEANGGFLTGSPIPLSGGTLQPLPTRDAVLPIVAVLSVARQRRLSLSALFAELPRRFTKSGLLDEVAPAQGRALLSAFGPNDPQVRAARREGAGFTVLDHSGERHPAGAGAERRFAELFATLEQHFTSERGFGPLVELDWLDGMRLHFEGGEVAHVRPSGNAPQLRIYALADSEARATEIAAMALAEPEGILRELLASGEARGFADAVLRNVEHTESLLSSGEPPRLIGTVSGTAQARAFWERHLEDTRAALGAREVVSLHEDLPVNQAFGLLLSWQRLRPRLTAGQGALIAFVFGEGSRATPFTEAECGQKPALTSFVAARANGAAKHEPPGVAASGAGQDTPGNGAPPRRYLSIVELGLRYFAPVEAHLRRSGFDGIVVKWGDEVQIPTADLSGIDPSLGGADVVRFVSMRPITPHEAVNKDWVGVDADGRITTFIPRRPLPEMERLAERGLLERRGAQLWGGINLGSIAVSRALLDVLLEEFQSEVNDPTADRRQRPDLDPQLFTALTVAAIEPAERRESAWAEAQESPSIRRLEEMLPGVLGRLRAALERFEARHGRKVRLRAMDFEDQYWGDVGQHAQMFEFYMALRDSGAAGRIARGLAGLSQCAPDEHGNLLVGSTRLGPGVRVKDSVLIDVEVESGSIERSVLVGTRAGSLRAKDAFDVESTVTDLTLEPRAGSYKLVSGEPLVAGSGERLTTVLFPDSDLLLRVCEDTGLRDRARNYDAPILGNALSFREAHCRVSAADPHAIEERRGLRRRAIAEQLARQGARGER